MGLNAHKEKATFGAVGVGTTTPLAAIDFSEAGQDGEGVFKDRMYMYPPQVTTAQINDLAGVRSGALIYNKSTDKLQVYVGTGSYNTNNWVDLH